MKHNYISDDIKKKALDDYLSGDASIKCVCEKYNMSTTTFNTYKNKNDDYVKNFKSPIIKMKKNKNEDQIVKDFLDTENLMNEIKKGKYQSNIYVDTSGDNKNKKHKSEKYKNIIDDIQNNTKINENKNNKNKNVETKVVNKTKKLKIISYEKEIEELINNAYKLE